ncbi:MAG: ubiquinone biosynthesis regulatory protein kinase UbiB [Chromatiales bacterium]|nr:ubiquinone biosynthesis regulatory protein kinase UbiB [Chromatiales bacterium]
MIRPSQALRLLHINWVLLRHGLDEIILAAHLFRPVRFLMYLTPWYWLRGELPPRGERIRRSLEDLGPIFVKFGQILSTRRDLLPDDIAVELARLQDRVPPFPDELSRKIIEEALGQPLEAVFSRFEPTPFASASIAQVHGAQLHDGSEVVVKVLRPGIEKTIGRDVGLLRIIADLAERYWKEGRRLRPVEVVQDYEKTIFDELDLVREAANASQLRRNFLGSEELYVPAVYWPYCKRNVMVMERIFGTPVGNIQSLRDQGIDFKLLGERGVEIFFTQVFRDNFFHADMHPGNIFVSPEGQYIAVDFGIIGTLTPSDQRYLANNLLAFFNRDYRRVAELHVESGWVPPETRVDQFESAIRTVCEPIFERPLKDISFGHFLLRLFQTARRFDMVVQPQLVLLQKTLLNIEGLGRQLYPELDLWSTAKPFLERWMKEQISPRHVLKQMRHNLPAYAEMVPDAPVLVADFLRQARQDQARNQEQAREMDALRVAMENASRRNRDSVAGAALLIAGALSVHLNLADNLIWLGLPIPGWILAGGGLLLLLRSLVGHE